MDAFMPMKSKTSVSFKKKYIDIVNSLSVGGFSARMHSSTIVNLWMMTILTATLMRL